MRIVADENMPFVRELFGHFGSVQTLPGPEITREAMATADVLLVRSVTHVGPELLHGSTVRFVGTATIGTDHIETDYLHQREIAWASAPGSNADSVVEYVLAVLLRLAARTGRPLRGATLGIVGCGSIGGRLARRAPHLGMKVLKNDPPLAGASGGDLEYRPLDEVMRRADVLTCHVPLTTAGAHPTRHLIAARELAALSADAWLINTSRGAVVDNTALLDVLRAGDLGAAVLDVWEDEPEPRRELIDGVDIATPHIAGYSYEGKANGTLMLLEALATHLGKKVPDPSRVIDTTRPAVQAPDPRLPESDWLHHLVLQMYDVGADDRSLRRGAAEAFGGVAATFNELRRTYPKRRTFSAHDVRAAGVPPAYSTAVLHGLEVGLCGPMAGTRTT